MTKYSNSFLIKQAYPIPNFTMSNSFPLIGDIVEFSNTSKNENSIQWVLNDGTELITSTSDSVQIGVNISDELEQFLTVENTVSTESISKIIYGVNPPNEAYYTFELNTNVAREYEEVTLTLKNKYNYVGEHTVNIIVTDHKTGLEILNITPVLLIVDIIIPTIGIYDIEIITTTGTKVINYKQGMILTITKALAPIENAFIHILRPTVIAKTFYGVPFSIINGSNYNFTNVTIPPGTTIVIRKDPEDLDDAICRLRLSNLHGTSENPIIVTIDSLSTFNLKFESYWGIIFDNCSHVILDGRGYNNLKLGLNIYSSSNLISMSGIQGANYSTNCEIHNCELHDLGFAGVFFKTDPDPNIPETWRPTIDGGVGFTLYDLKIHNNYIHNTGGEGNYLGYFSNDVLTHANTNGEAVTYRPHKLIDTKVYRNTYYRCGWDSIQLNNSYGDTEIAHNSIIDTAWYGAPNQNTGISCGIEGKIYNNIIRGGSGIGIQIGLLGETNIYNNIVSGLPDGAHALFLLSTILTPEQNVNGSLTNNININVYNNTFLVGGNAKIVSALNVCQYPNLYFSNNLYRSNGDIFGGQFIDTNVYWHQNKRNNIQITNKNLRSLKLGSIEDGDFNIYPTSTLSSGGLLIEPLYDIRGFKNISSNGKFIGSHTSITSLSDSVLILNSLTIGDGSGITKTRFINIIYTSIGNVTHYKISESVDIDSSPLISIVNNIQYTLTQTEGVKTIYFKLFNSLSESVTLSGDIFYTESKKYLIALNRHVVSENTVAPWNNFNIPSSGLISNGLELRDLVDQYSTKSNLVLTVVSPFDGYDSSVDSVLEYPFPITAVKYAWKILKTGSISGIGTLELSNCDQNKIYDIILYANKKYNGGTSIYSVNGVDQYFSVDYINYQNVCTFSNVSPNILNKIIISVRPNIDLVRDGVLALINIVERSINVTLNSIIINNGAISTNDTIINIQINIDGVATHYMISEDENFTTSIWLPYLNNNLDYQLINQSLGVKNIYLKLKYNSVISETKTSSIEYLGQILILDSVSVNSNNTYTTSNVVTVVPTFRNGTPDHYKIGENDNLTLNDWEIYTGNILYTLLTQGQHTIYMQLIKDVEITNTVVANSPIIYYAIKLNSITLNNNITPATTENINVLFNYNGDAPTHYMLSEDINFTNDVWVSWTGVTNNTVNFVLSSLNGVKTIYAKLKNVNELVSETVTNSITKEITMGSRTYLIDVGSYTKDYFTTGNCNNFLTITSGTLGSVVPINTNTTLIDNSGINSTLILYITTSGWTIEPSNFSISDVLTVPYVFTTYRDSFRVAGLETGKMEIRNCNPLKQYTIRIFSGRAFVGANTNFIVGGVTKTINPKNNYNTILEWVNVIPTNNIIEIECTSVTASIYGYINTIEIIEY